MFSLPAGTESDTPDECEEIEDVFELDVLQALDTQRKLSRTCVERIERTRLDEYIAVTTPSAQDDTWADLMHMAWLTHASFQEERLLGRCGQPRDSSLVEHALPFTRHPVVRQLLRAQSSQTYPTRCVRRCSSVGEFAWNAARMARSI